MSGISADVLVGRVAELSELDRRVALLAEGCGGLVWVEGEPGIGKSALANAVRDRASDSGAAVLRGGGDELLQGFPLRVMAECLGVSGRSADAARVEIDGLLRGSGGGSGTVDPVLAAGERMLDLVDRLCARGPLVVITEDLHWADEPSLRLWSRLARAVDQIPLLLVGTARPVPRRAPVDRLGCLVRESGGLVLGLGPLDPGEVARVAAGVAGGVPGPRLCAELERAGGNALYVRELVGALLDERLVEVDGGVAEFTGDGGATPGSLSSAIVHRLGFLSERTGQMLRLAALMGSEFDASLLAVASGVSVGELNAAVTEAMGAGVVVDAGERLMFRHALIQQALVGQIPEGMLRTLHGHIAHVLMEADAVVAAIVPHLLALPGLIDDRALTWLGRVDAAALLAAPQISARLLGAALDCVGEADPRREALAVRQTEVLLSLGRDDQVVETASAIAQSTGDSELEARMWIQVMRSAARAGRLDEASAVSARVLRDARLPALWRSRVETWSAITSCLSGRLEESRASARRALVSALDSGDPLTVGYAHHAAAFIHDGGPEELECLEQGIAVLGEDPESMDLRILMTCNWLVNLYGGDQVDRFRAELPKVLMLAERVGTMRVASIRGLAVEVCFTHGDWDEAEVHFDAIDPEFSAHRNEIHLHGICALVALHQGDRRRAARHLEVVDRVLPQETAHQGYRSQHIFAARVLSAELEGDPRRALASAATWLDNPAGLRPFERSDEAPDLVRLALALGDRETARAGLELMLDIAKQYPTIQRSMRARLCQAQFDDDAEALSAIAEECRGRGWVPLTGFALEEAAARFAAAGDVARARGALTDAVRAYAGLGAEFDIRRADARLRTLGVRRGPRSLHRRESAGWEALTPGETRIAGLVAEGKSNPDIAAELVLSRHTVQTHVSHILAKLQLRSRAEVIRAVAERG